VAALSLTDHCVRAGIATYSAEVCKVSWMPAFAAAGAAQDQQGAKSRGRSRTAAELAERVHCWQLSSTQSLKDSEARSAAVRKKHGRAAVMPDSVQASVEAETVSKLRELFVPASFMLKPDPTAFRI